MPWSRTINLFSSSVEEDLSAIQKSKFGSSSTLKEGAKHGREQQLNDEYLASLLADGERDVDVLKGAETSCSKEGESQNKMLEGELVRSNSRRPSQADEEAHQLWKAKEKEKEKEKSLWFCPWKDLSTLDFFFNLVTKDLK